MIYIHIICSILHAYTLIFLVFRKFHLRRTSQLLQFSRK